MKTSLDEGTMWSRETRISLCGGMMGMTEMKDGRVLHPEQRITREEALKTYTIWGAYMQKNEKAKGSIETGKLADLVEIDRDYLTCPEDQIRQIQPVTVILDGTIVARH